MSSVELSGFPPGVYTVCWYHEFQRNAQDRYLPQVNVVLRSEDNVHSKSSYREVPVGINYLGQLRIGSTVNDGIVNDDEIEGPFRISCQERLDVDFTRGSWTLEDASALARNLLSDIPWLRDFEPRGPMLVFPLEKGRSLWIPCIEFFSRCYSRSQEIKRILSLYSWDRAKRRLFGEDDMPGGDEGFDGWTIWLRRPFVEDDAVFLAHVWYDPYTEGCAKSIYAQLESALPVVPRPLPWKSFVEVRPWFEGPAELLVRGFWLRDGRDRKFLALRVDGCSDPRGKPVRYVPSVDKSSSPGAAAEGDTVRYFRRRRVRKKTRLTDRVEPDRGSRRITLEDPPFEVLGISRDVNGVGIQREEGAGRPSKGKSSGPAEYSSSEQYSRGKDVGEVHIVAPVRQPLGDVLSDMWKTLLHLQKKYPALVSSVAWVADEGSRFHYRAEEPPQLILLESFGSEEDEEFEIRNWNWPWLDPDPKDPQRLGRRGLFVMRCLVRGYPVYFVEVQRRPRRKEKFSGMVFRLNREMSLDRWLYEICFRVRHVEGVFSYLCSVCPGIAREFVHFPGPEGTVLYEAAVVEALSKVGLDLPKGSTEERKLEQRLGFTDGQGE